MTPHNERNQNKKSPDQLLNPGSNLDRDGDQINAHATSQGRRGILTGPEESPSANDGPSTEQQTKVLFAKLADGSYVFTSGQVSETDVGEQLDTAGEVNLINVLPYSTELDTIRLLKDAHRPAPAPLPSAFPLPNTEIMPVQFLNFGPYLTFAPVTDSHLATLTPNETARARELKLKRRALKYFRHASKSSSQKSTSKTSERNGGTEELNGNTGEDNGIKEDKAEDMDIDLAEDTAEGQPEVDKSENIVHTPTSPLPSTSDNSDLDLSLGNTLENIDREAFLAEGIDINALLSNAGSAANGSTKATLNEPIVEQLLAENVELLVEFQQLQNARFASNVPANISDEEQTVASALLDNLATLANSITPSKLVTPKAIEQTMNRLPRYDAGYAGTLPPNKPRAYFYQNSTAPQHFSTSDPVHTPTMTPSRTSMPYPGSATSSNRYQQPYSHPYPLRSTHIPPQTSS